MASERDIVVEIEMAGRLGYSMQITEAGARRVTALLQERAALIGVADAARRLLDPKSGTTVYEDRVVLQQALAALDAPPDATGAKGDV